MACRRRTPSVSARDRRRSSRRPALELLSFPDRCRPRDRRAAAPHSSDRGGGMPSDLRYNPPPMSSDRVTLEVSERGADQVGSRRVRRLRKEGLVPGVLYGKGHARAIVVQERELRTAMTGPSGLHAILDVVIEGQTTAHHAVLKDYQQDPIRGTITHIDLHEVRLDQPIQATVDRPARRRVARVEGGRQRAARSRARSRSRRCRPASPSTSTPTSPRSRSEAPYASRTSPRSRASPSSTTRRPCSRPCSVPRGITELEEAEAAEAAEGEAGEAAEGEAAAEASDESAADRPE